MNEAKLQEFMGRMVVDMGGAAMMANIIVATTPITTIPMLTICPIAAKPTYSIKITLYTHACLRHVYFFNLRQPNGATARKRDAEIADLANGLS